MSLSGQTDLLKLYARVISFAPAGKVKTDKSICRPLRDYVTETVRNVCLFDTTSPQNRALHDVLHILHTGSLLSVLSLRQFEASQLITFTQ